MLSIPNIIQMHSWIEDFPSSRETFPFPWAQPSFQRSKLHTNTLPRLRNSWCRFIWNPDLFPSLFPIPLAEVGFQVCTFLQHFQVPERAATPESQVLPSTKDFSFLSQKENVSMASPQLI